VYLNWKPVAAISFLYDFINTVLLFVDDSAVALPA
jgi:hypothetical protein